MNIYIFGSDKFKTQINKIITSYRISSKIEPDGEIREINTAKMLKDLIRENPNDIFLIDNEKIIYDTFVTKVFKFLVPKDGIEKEFLVDNGIGDFSVDTFDDLAKHVITRLEAKQFHQEISVNNEKQNITVEKSHTHLNIVEDDKHDEDDIFETMDILELDEPKHKQSTGEIMSDLTQLDEITEADILDALSMVDGIDVKSSGDTIKITSSSKAASEQTSHTIEVDSSNMESVASLLEQLMNNKTLEISIRVKS